MKKILFLLLTLFSSVFALQLSAQDLSDYTFSTGVDASKWVSLNSPDTILLISGTSGDSRASSVQNIGFAFSFGDNTYTQFSVNSDGNLRFGPTATGTSNYSTPFSSTNASVNNPKINLLGCDGFITDSGYVNFEVTGVAPERVCVIEFALSTYNTTSRPSLLRWQVQLFEGSNNIQIAYPSTTPPILPNATRQPGMCIDNTDIILVNANHQMTHYTTGQGTANIATGNWPDVNRYYLFTAPTVLCPKVFNLAPTMQTTNSISLEFETLGDETSWQIDYYPVVDTNDVTTITVNTTTPTLSNLENNTEYVISVYAVCSNGSGLSMPRTIHALTLPTDPATLPYECDFEDPDENDNWTFLSGNAANQWVIGDATSMNDMQSLYISNDGTHNAYYSDSAAVVFAIRDVYFDPSYDSYSIQFDYKGEGQMNTDYFRLYFSKQPQIVTPNNTGTLTAPANSSYLTTNGSGSLGLVPDWRHINLVLDNTYSGKTVRFYFTWVNNNTAGANPPIAIDNFSVTGNSCSKPYGVHIYDSIPNTLTVTWQDSSYATAFDVALVPYYGGSPELSMTTVTDNTYTFTDVPVNQYHTLYLRSVCQEGKSAWAAYVGGPQCSTISTLPFVENFDAYGTGGSGTSTAYLTCWSRKNNYSTTTYPYLSSTYKSSGSGSLYFNASSSTYYAYAILPELDTIAISWENLQMSLKGYITNTTNTYGRFDVGVMTDPNDVSTFTPVKSFYHSDFSALSTWCDFKVQFSNYIGSGSYIAIRIPNTGANALYIDDVVLDEIPVCAQPENLTVSNRGAHSFRVNWTTTTPAYAFEVALLSPIGAAMETAITTTVSTMYADFTGLDANSGYQVFVRAICDNDENSEWTGPVNVYTLCESSDEIPFTEDFDTYGGSGAAYFPGCWVRHTDQTTNYPYINTAQYASGTSALYFYSTSTGYSMAASQGLDLSQYDANTLALSFKVKKTSDSYGRLDVGIMTDPDDMSSMIVLKSIYPSDYANTSEFHEFSIPLTNHYENVVYIGFLAPSGTTNYVNLDDVTIDYLPTCSAPSHLTFSSVAGTSALVSWDPAPYGVEDYTLEYTEAGQDNWISITSDATSYLFSDLTQGTAYDLRVYSNCTEGSADTLTGSFSTLTYLDCDVEDTVGTAITGSSSVTTYYVPVNNLYKYSYNQMIYTANEINPAHTATVITALAFQYNYSTAMTQKTNVKVYMAHRSDSIFNSTTDWTPINNATLVYEGPLNCSQGWNKFNLNNFFSYNGSDNLVIIVDDNSFAYNSSSYNFNAHTKTNSVLYKGHDTENLDPSNPPTGTRSANRPNIKLYTCNQIVAVTCVAPNIYDYAVESDNITFNWTAGLNESSWELRYKASTDNDWTTEIVTTSPYTIENLTASTDYIVEMRSICGNEEYSDWVSFNISTPCEDITLPFTESFENAVGSSYACFVPCWSRKTNYSTSYPYVTTNTQAPSGSNVLSLNASSTYYSYAATPRFAEDVVMDSLQISFQARKASANYFVEVGIMTDPSDPSTFQLIGNFSPTEINDWQMGEIRTSAYTGNGRYVAFRVPQWISNIVLVDDIMIDYIPNCLHVEDIQMTDVTATTATIQWTPGGDESTWMYVYGPEGTININTIGDEAWQTIHEDSVMLEELIGNTAYEIFVKAACDNGEVSTAMSYEFRTACVAISTLPYIENFDDWGVTTSSTEASPGPKPACWTRNYVYSTPMPYCHSTYNYNGVAGLYFYASGAGYTELIAAPQLDDNIEVTELQLSIMCRAMSAVSYLYIGVMDDPNNLSTFVPVDTVMANSTTWHQERVLFSNYTGTGKYVALKFAPSSSGYFMVDNFVLDMAPSCDDPTAFTVDNVSTNSATLSWEDDDAESSWEILVVPSNITNPDFTLAENVTNNTYSMFDLVTGADYTAYLRTVCSNGEGYSNWITLGFSTLLAEAADVPYFHDFEDGEENAAWYLNNGTQANKWYIGKPVGESDSVLFISQNGNSTDYSISSTSNVWAYRDFNFGEGAEFGLSFNWKAQGESCCDYLKVYLGTPASVTSGSVTVPEGAVQLGGTMNVHATWQHFETTLNSSYANTTQRLYLLWHNDGSGGSAPAAVIDSIEITASDCGRPYNVAVSAIDNESATITFSPAFESDNAWEYIFASGIFPNDSNITPQNIQDNTISLTGLDENTIYSMYVRTVCGGGSYSGWTEILTFHTLCEAVSALPYTEDFNSYTSVATSTTAPSGYPDVELPDCWTIFNMSESTSTYPQVFLTSSTTYAASGNCLFFKSSSTTPAYAVLPSFTTSIQALQLSFTYRNEGTSTSNGTLHVGYMTSPADPSTFVSVYTCPQTTTLTDVEVAFNNIAYTGTGAVIAFKYEGGSANNYYVSIDNVMVDNIPTCPKPTALTSSNVTANSLTLSWTAGGNESEWIVEYGIAGFAHGTGTIAQVQGTPTTNITGLSASSNYDFYVRALCGGGDTSYWSHSYTVSTDCGIVTELPYADGFDSYGTGTTVYPACWSKINTYTSGDRPYINTGGHNSPALMYFYAGTSGTYNIAITPEFDASIQINTLKAKFWHKGSGTNDRLIVGVMSSITDASTFVPVDTVYVSSPASTWHECTVLFANYTGQGHFIAFKNEYTTTSAYAYLDDLVISLDSAFIPGECNVPINLTTSGITSNSADVTWTAGGSETAWNVQYKTGTADWTTVPVNAATYHLSGLTAETTYQVRVQANCGNGNLSDWTAAISFTTETEPVDPCDAPTNLQVNSITQTSATMTWTAGGSETSWKVGYKLSTASQWQEATVQTTSYDIEGLTANSTYDVRVKAICAADNESDFVTNSFTTEGVGIDKISLANSISLMPNPADNYIELSINSNVEVKEAVIFNAFGQMIQTVQLTENHARIDLSNMAAGMYFLRVNGEGVTATKKFIKR